MELKKILGILIAGILVNFTIFPIALKAFPQLNFKMIIAACGLVVFLFEILRKKSLSLDKGFITVSAFALLISFAVLLSTTINGTRDYTLISYAVSAWVWLGAAYFVCRIINSVHGHIDFPILSWYVIGVAFFQCISALAIDKSQYLYNWTTQYIYMDMVNFAALRKAGRIFGLGSALDFSGIRLACIIIMAFHLLTRCTQIIEQIIIWISIAFITVIGSMIARTTFTGTLMGLGYYIIVSILKIRNKIQWNKVLLGASLLLVSAGLFLTTRYLYLNDDNFHEHLRFGFEGIFNLAETGEFETHSTNILKNMVILPDNLKTWIIGDGYFQGMENDPNYLGEHWIFFYKGTDIGYLRFIYYFGLIGLSFFILLYVSFASFSAKNFKKDKFAIWVLFLENLLVWVKVASDTFIIFALIMCAYIVANNNKQFESNVV